MRNQRRISFAAAAEPWRHCVAECLRKSTETQGVRTKATAEWLRVADLARIVVVIDLDTRTFVVSPPLFWQLVNEQLLLTGKEVADGQ